ncbi:hypothetical protein QEN19_000789 [Hanseniaspora menglaensis]
MSQVSGFVLTSSSAATLTKRGLTSDVSSTVKSAKHWDTCMANRPCKIIAIVFIVIGGILAFWLIGSILRCLKTGCEGWISFCCWPCQNKSHSSRQQQLPPPIQPQYTIPQHQQQWNSNGAGRNPYYANENNQNDYGRVYEDQLELETQDFDLEAQKQKSTKKLQQVDNEDTSSWFNYNQLKGKAASKPSTTTNNTYEEYNPYSKFSQNSNKH